MWKSSFAAGWGGFAGKRTMNATLLVLAGKTTKGKVALKLPCVLGRSKGADVVVPHPLVSRRHCELSESGGLLILRDLASSNGTMIDGRRITSAPLPPDSEFTIGPLIFRVQYKYGGNLESLPPICFVEEPTDAEEVEFAEFTEAPADAVDEPSPAEAVPPSAAEIMDVPDFVALAEDESEEIVAAELAEPEFLDDPPIEELGPSAPTWADLVGDDTSPQAATGEKRESPWASEAPDVEPPKRPAVKEKARADAPPPTPPSPPATKKPNSSDEVDPEFGSFLDDLQ